MPTTNDSLGSGVSRARWSQRRVTDGLLILMLLGLFGAAAPGFFFASDTASAVALFEPDAPAVVMPPLLDLYNGQLVPQFCAYGHLPAYFSGALFAPLLVPMKLYSGSIDYFYFALAMRGAQLLMGALALVYVYRLGLICLPPWLALVGAALVLAMPEFGHWTLSIHPDIYQTAAIAAAVFYLVRWGQSGRRGDWLFSAVCAGLAAAAKFYGVFLFPAAAWAAWSGSRASGGAIGRRVAVALGLSAVYVAVAMAVFALFNVRILLWDERCREWFLIIGAIPQAAGAASELFAGKLSNWSSPNLLGPLFLAVYLVAALRWVVAMAANRRAPHDWPGASLGVVHAALATFAVYYFGIYSDAYNIYHGERYALPLFVLLPVPTLALLYELTASPKFGRWGWLLSGLVAATSALRIVGAPLDVYYPLPTVIDRRLYVHMLYVCDDRDRATLTAAYRLADGAERARMQRPLAPDLEDRLREYWRQRCFLRSRPTTAAHRLTFPYRKERTAAFGVRAWIIAHAKADATLYAEPGLNLLPTTMSSVEYSDNRDLPTRNVCVEAIDLRKINRLRPDYVLTAHAPVADAVLKRDAQYELAERLAGKGEVFILRRRPQPDAR